MTSTLIQSTRPRITEAISQFIEHLRTPLYANAYALIANQIASAGLGFLYWLLAARLYTPDVVGQSSATISMLLFLAALAELSLKSAMTRFVPRAGTRTPRLIVYTYSVNLLAAALVSSIFFLAGSHFQFAKNLFADIPVPISWLVLTTMVWCIFYVQDGVLTGLRQAVWVLIENSLYNVAKIVLLVIGVRVFLEHGIVASWFLPTPLLVLLVTALIFWRFVPQYITANRAQAAGVQATTITPRQVVTSVTGDHIGTLLAETSARLLPLLVLERLGKSENAYFYQAWVIATTLYYVAGNMTSSFTVEAAANLGQIAVYSRRILLHMARLIAPMALAVFIAAPLGLSFFGAAYARESTTLLRWLSAAALPIIFNTWYLSYARVTGHIKAIILYQGLVSVLTLGLSYLWLPKYGIVSIGIAWLISQSLVAILVAAKTAPMLLSSARGDVSSSAAQTVSFNRLLRRVDWRFLLSMPTPRKTVVFTEGLLARSVAEISGQVMDGRSATANGCDLAVAVNPNLSTLRAAYDALHEDGACYTEWTPWRAGGPRGIERQLQAAGFIRVRLYWPAPAPDMSRFWLALRAQSAPYRYLASQLFMQDSLPHRVVQAMLPVVLQVAVQTGMTPHLSAIAYKSSSGSAHPPRLQDLSDYIGAELSRTHTELSAESLSFLVRTGGPNVDNKVNCMVFAGSDPHPHWVIKLPRVAASVQALRRERDILESLRFDSGARETLVSPRVELWCDTNGVLIFGQTALTGLLLSTALRPASFHELAIRIADGLARWAGRPPALPRELWWGRLVEPLFAQVEDGFGAVLEPGTLLQTREILSALSDLPLVFAHNDCAPWNVVMLEEGLGMLDWEEADPQGLPLADLVYCVSNMAFVLDGTVSTEHMAVSYQALLDPATRTGQVFHESVARYAAQIGLDPANIRPLRVLTWLFHLHSEYQGFVVEAGERPPLEMLQRSVILPLLETELYAR
jgi:O-antigen/teichoic acid export membrane protein